MRLDNQKLLKSPPPNLLAGFAPVKGRRALSVAEVRCTKETLEHRTTGETKKAYFNSNRMFIPEKMRERSTALLRVLVSDGF